MKNFVRGMLSVALVCVMMVLAGCENAQRSSDGPDFFWTDDAAVRGGAQSEAARTKIMVGFPYPGQSGDRFRLDEPADRRQLFAAVIRAHDLSVRRDAQTAEVAFWALALALAALAAGIAGWFLSRGNVAGGNARVGPQGTAGVNGEPGPTGPRGPVGPAGPRRATGCGVRCWWFGICHNQPADTIRVEHLLTLIEAIRGEGVTVRNVGEGNLNVILSTGDAGVRVDQSANWSNRIDHTSNLFIHVEDEEVADTTADEIDEGDVAT